MTKEEINNNDNSIKEDSNDQGLKDISSKSKVKKEEILPEDKIKNLEDKLARTLAEMENQRRRFEKEREDAFEYGGFAFAKEALNLIEILKEQNNLWKMMKI